LEQVGTLKKKSDARIGKIGNAKKGGFDSSISVFGASEKIDF
jgi:hypothetical protein